MNLIQILNPANEITNALFKSYSTLNEIVPLLLGFRYSWVRYCKVKL